jgi:cellulose biosynthesis protein BcsQ
VSQVLLGDEGLRDTIMQAGTDEHPRRGLWVLPATNELAAAKHELVAREAVATVVKRYGGRQSSTTTLDDVLTAALGPLADVFEYVILDCPPTLDVLQTAVYRFAGAAIVPVKADFLSMAGALQHTRDIVSAQAAGIQVAIMAIIPTFMDTRLGQARDVFLALVETYGPDKVAQPIPLTVKLSEAPEFGMTIFEYAEHTRNTYAQAAADAYMDTVRRILA